MIELGGNIKLINFDEVEPALLIVIKKVVGNYTKKISESIDDFKSIEVSLENKKKNKIHVKVEGSDVKEADAEDKNLFFALDRALGAVLKG
ncbi:MAG: hypothetical protein ABIB47_04580 [Candidatus Woesearchaeota archaeon]